jgi:hypothetical protein
VAVSSPGYERKTCSALGEGWMTMRRECACRFSVNVRLRLDGFPSHALLHACYDFSRRGPSFISFYTPPHLHHFHRIWSVRIHPATSHAPARPNASLISVSSLLPSTLHDGAQSSASSFPHPPRLTTHPHTQRLRGGSPNLLDTPPRPAQHRALPRDRDRTVSSSALGLKSFPRPNSATLAFSLERY